MGRTENVELTVVCLLEDGGRVLLQNRKKEDWHGWALPGEPEQEIKDPYGKGVEEYNACFELIYRLVGNVAEYLDKLSEEKEDKGEEQ